MSAGNEISVNRTDESIQPDDCQAGSIIAEATVPLNKGKLLGVTTSEFNDADLIEKWEGVLCEVFK
ncbi:MAG: hypothetical protein LBT88_02600, partial [Oscillospiraceae bacterium]|jgi:hypothetical protein|nr:hypothetical protein [Oscillospiraceae bacterium]